MVSSVDYGVTAARALGGGNRLSFKAHETNATSEIAGNDPVGKSS